MSKKCSEIQLLKAKEYREANKDQIRETQRRYLERHRERLLISMKDHYLRNKDRYREVRDARQFDISPEEKQHILDSQGGVCAICEGPERAKNKLLSIDHDHFTGKVRGILCRGCNVGIGNLQDSPFLLKKALWYLTRDRGTTQNIPTENDY